MKVADLKKKTVADLEKHAAKLRGNIADMRKDRHITEVKNVKSIKNNRVELARTLTLIKEKEGEK